MSQKPPEIPVRSGRNNLSVHPSAPFVWDEALIRRYDLSGPRYTSYPTALEFSDWYTNADMMAAASRSRDSGRPLSLYVHLPFCAHLCYYCACNKVITRKRERAEPYVTRLLKEASWQAKLYGDQRPVQQLHWGGGTPTFLPTEDMRRLMNGLGELINLQTGPERDYSIEIDPREMADGVLQTLSELGFNRLSLGVQDLDPVVQKAINRIQPRRMTAELMAEARDLGFGSINLDLIYGLPYQTPESFAATVDSVLELLPDRLSIFNYAHLPERFYPQSRIKPDTLPGPERKLAMLEQTIRQLLDAGYEYIGMDHFARPEDPLSQAQHQGRLQRNFQGYTTHANCDLMALGVSAIGQTEDAYFQNSRDLAEWEQQIDRGELAIVRGLALTRDDRIRRWVIHRLICQFRLDREEFRDQWELDFNRYFSVELTRLQPMLEDGLLQNNGDVLHVQPPGRLLIRAICQLFDRYRDQTGGSDGFSRIL